MNRNSINRLITSLVCVVEICGCISNQSESNNVKIYKYKESKPDYMVRRNYSAVLDSGKLSDSVLNFALSNADNNTSNKYEFEINGNEFKAYHLSNGVDSIIAQGTIQKEPYFINIGTVPCDSSYEDGTPASMTCFYREGENIIYPSCILIDFEQGSFEISTEVGFHYIPGRFCKDVRFKDKLFQINEYSILAQFTTVFGAK